MDTMTRMIAACYTSCFACKRPLILWRTFSSTGTKYMCFNISSVFPLCLGSAVISTHTRMRAFVLWSFQEVWSKENKDGSVHACACWNCWKVSERLPERVNQAATLACCPNEWLVVISMERTMLCFLLLKPKVLYEEVKKEYLTKLSHAMKSAFVKIRQLQVTMWSLRRTLLSLSDIRNYLISVGNLCSLSNLLFISFYVVVLI